MLNKCKIIFLMDAFVILLYYIHGVYTLIMAECEYSEYRLTLVECHASWRRWRWSRHAGEAPQGKCRHTAESVPTGWREMAQQTYRSGLHLGDSQTCGRTLQQQTLLRLQQPTKLLALQLHRYVLMALRELGQQFCI